MDAAAWMMIVDLPMPGSPVISAMLPCTSPPPSTRLSSPMPVSMRVAWLLCTSPMRTGLGALPSSAPEAVRLLTSAAGSGTTFSSTKEFQAPQMH